VLYRDNFAQTAPPEQWALDFRNEACDALTMNSVRTVCYITAFFYPHSSKFPFML
jgi:hypothetical protein